MTRKVVIDGDTVTITIVDGTRFSDSVSAEYVS